MTESMVLCERPAHVQRALATVPQAGLVAVTPESVWWCQQRGVPYVRLDEFYAHAAMNEFAAALMPRQYAWIRWLDDALATSVPAFADLGFQPARGQLWLLKRVWDAFIRPVKVLQEFVAHARPRHVIVFERDLADVNFSYEPPTSSGRPLFAAVAPDALRHLTDVEVWADEGAESDAVTGRFSRPRLGSSARHLVGAWIRWMAQIPANLPARRGRVAWVGNRGYDMPFTVPLLRGRGVAVVSPVPSALGSSTRVEARRLRMSLESFWSRARVLPEFWALVDDIEPALRRLIEPFLKDWLLEELPWTWTKFLEAREWLRRGRFDAVMGMEVPPLLASTCFMAAQSLGIPRVMAIHNGGLTMDIPVQDCLGPIQCDVYLVSCEEEADYYEHLAAWLDTFPRAQMKAVGSARLDALQQAPLGRARREALRAQLGIGRNTPVVLYIPTQFRSYGRYFCEGSFSDAAYFELQQRILRCVAEYPEVRLLYKPFPREFAVNPIGQFLAREVPNGQVTMLPVTELVWVADAIIIDFPATPLHEAALTDKLLVVFAGRDWARLLPQAKQALEKRAWVSETPEEFESQVRRLLASRHFSPVARPDQEFLRLVGVDHQGHASAERFTDAVERVVVKDRMRSRRGVVSP